MIAYFKRDDALSSASTSIDATNRDKAVAESIESSPLEPAVANLRRIESLAVDSQNGRPEKRLRSGARPASRPDGRQHFNRDEALASASTWESLNNYDKAINVYGAAIRLDPQFADAYVHRGQAWAIKKEHKRAIADYNDAIRLNPASAARILLMPICSPRVPTRSIGTVEKPSSWPPRLVS